MGRLGRLVPVQRKVRSGGAQAHPAVRQPRPGQRRPRLRRRAGSEEELQRALPLRGRQVVLVVVVVLLQPRLHPVQAEAVQQPGAEERGEVLLRREGPGHADLRRRNVQT